MRPNDGHVCNYSKLKLSLIVPHKKGFVFKTISYNTVILQLSSKTQDASAAVLLLFLKCNYDNVSAVNPPVRKHLSGGL